MDEHRESAAKRAYSSPLRDAQREATRRAILEAAGALLQSPDGELTVAAIAARAGVSVPTVNRHFPTRQALLEGVAGFLDARSFGAPPKDLDPARILTTDLRPMVQALFRGFAHLAGTPLATAAVLELRGKVTIPRRRKLAEDAMEASLPGLREPHRTWLADLLVVLVSSSMVATMQGYLGLPPEESAKRLEWLLEALVADARARSERAARTRSTPRSTKKKTTKKTTKRGVRR